MPEEHATIPVPPVPQLLRAHEHLLKRGESLPVTALRVLAREVILRVSQIEPVQLPHDGLPRTAEVELLCDALLSPDDTAAADLVRAARLDGMSPDALYHAYIAEAARRLGVRWDRDEATASQVILGAGRVYAILRDLRAIFLAERLRSMPGAEAVFATVPGEVHGIGATIAADTLRRNGWDITLRLGLGHQALVDDIARLRPTMIGLASSLPAMTFATARLIVALRVRCPGVWIMVAGPIVEHDPDIARIVDADAAAATLDEATALMTGHLDDLIRLRSERG